jgi:hypothetical protein
VDYRAAQLGMQLAAAFEMLHGMFSHVSAPAVIDAWVARARAVAEMSAAAEEIAKCELARLVADIRSQVSLLACCLVHVSSL